MLQSKESEETNNKKGKITTTTTKNEGLNQFYSSEQWMKTGVSHPDGSPEYHSATLVSYTWLLDSCKRKAKLLKLFVWKLGNNVNILHHLNLWKLCKLKLWKSDWPSPCLYFPVVRRVDQDNLFIFQQLFSKNPASTPRWVPDGPNVVFHVGPIWVFPAWPHIGVANGHRMGPIWGNNGYPCGAQIEPTKYPDEAHIETTWYLGAAHMVPGCSPHGTWVQPTWYLGAAHTGPRFNPNGTQI